MRHRAGPLLFVVALALLAVAPASAGAGGSGRDPGAVPALAPLPRIDPDSPSLSPSGSEQLRRADLADAPRASVSAAVDPVSGAVEGRYRARLARPDDGTLRLRMLAGLRSYRAGLDVRAVRVDDEPATATRRDALLELDVPRGMHRFVEVSLEFSYRVPRGTDTRGQLLTPDTIGVLTRHPPGTLLLGHWFPLWVPPGADADADLSGYGDIGNFAAGAITARVAVPEGYDVYGPGVQVEARPTDTGTVVTRTGVGFRDLSLVVSRGLVPAEARAGEVVVRAATRTALDAPAAADDAAASLAALETTFGPYPWSELAALDVPLGPQVGGMEWPGAIWIDGFQADAAFDDVVAHELAHQYWHALVGNDSLVAAVVDEPLAQYSTCLLALARTGDNRACRFGGRVRPGGPPPCIDRRTDEFGPGEYGALVYGEAPDFYVELERLIGTEAVVAALRGIVDRHAFATLTAAELRDELAAAAPDRAADVTALWDRIIGAPGCTPATR